MAWIPIHDDLYEHPKTRKCARALGEPLLVTFTRLTLFWLWCMKYAKHGDLTDIDTFDVEEAVKWTEEPGKFMEALEASGFTDRFEDGTLIVHDWDKYGGKLVKKMDADAARKKGGNGNPKNSAGIPASYSNGNSQNSDGIPADIPKNPVGNTRNSDVRKEKKREEEKRGEYTPPPKNPSAQPIDLTDLLTRAVLVATGKLTAFEIGSRSPNDVTNIAKAVNLLRHDGRSVQDVELVARYWPEHLGKSPAEVQPLTPQQFLSQFDNLLGRAKATESKPKMIDDPDELQRQMEEFKRAKAGGAADE